MANHTAVETRLETVSTYALFIRWLVTFHLLALAAQLASAIAFAGGWATGALLHIHGARLVGALGLLQAAAVVSLPAGRLKTPYRLYAVGVLIGEAMQLYYRTTHGFALHVTTAFIIWAFSVAVSIKVWAPTWKLVSEEARGRGIVR
jgi:hypothetical protein